MAYNQVLLDLDITGKNPDNLIPDEPHKLSDKPTRSIAVNYGPFFAEGLIIRDGARTLSRGHDYQIVELHQEATLKYGKEIASVILIINQDVSTNITVTYQALGGHYTYSDVAISNMYESIIKDNRPVDWEHIFNKPDEYPPALHRHLVEDVYGFEAIVDYLERIRKALTLGNTDLIMSLLYKLLGGFGCRELPKILPNKKIIQYDAFLFFLSRRKMIYPIWVDKVDCLWRKGDSFKIEVDTSAYPTGTLLRWELYVPDGKIQTFAAKYGIFTTNGSIRELQIYIPADELPIDDPLYIGIKEKGSDIDYKAVTYTINIRKTPKSVYNLPYILETLIDRQPGNPYVFDTYEKEDEMLYHMLMTP